MRFVVILPMAMVLGENIVGGVTHGKNAFYAYYCLMLLAEHGGNCPQEK